MFLSEQILNGMPPKSSRRGKKRSGSRQGTPSSAAKPSDDEIDEEDVESTKDAEILRLQQELASTRAQLNQDMDDTPVTPGRGAHSGGPRARGAYSGGLERTLPTYRLGSLRTLPSDIPDVKNMADVIRLRSSLFNILGARSFLLRCSQAEARLQDGKTKKFYNDKWKEFEANHAPGSMIYLQQDYYLALSQLCRRSTLLARFPDDVSSEQESCATHLWNAIMSKYPPDSPNMKSMLYASIASQLLNGPGHAHAAFDRTVASAVVDLQDMPPLTPAEFTACMVYAGLSNSEEPHWRYAAQRLRENIEDHGTFDLEKIRFLMGNSAVETGNVYAFSAKYAPPVPHQGLDRPLHGCSGCPLGHCQYQDGKYRPAPRGGAPAQTVSAMFSRLNVDNIDNAGGARSSRTSSRASARSTSGASDRGSVAPTYAWYPKPPSVSQTTRDAMEELERFNPNTQTQEKYTAMMAKLRHSLEDDRCRHAYNAGAHANRDFGEDDRSDTDQDYDSDSSGWVTED
jgi:hypothetical protein